ncbi:hypothetical protein BH09VER1_BH09VER1_43070 [soil metagenome]
MHPGTQPRIIRRVLVTGASGYLGRSLCEVLAEDFDLLRMDVVDSEGPGEFLRASVTDAGAVDAACQHVDAIVLAHMAPNRPEIYDWPDACMDINVKGTALAFEAAARHNIRRAVLISSISVVGDHERRKAFLTGDLPLAPINLYTMTKGLQEEMAGYYHRHRGLEIAMLRPACILREDSLVNKYGKKRDAITWHCIDPRDIGRAAHAALRMNDLKLEAFYLAAGPGAEEHVDLASAEDRLGWTPKYRFEGIAVEPVPATTSP